MAEQDACCPNCGGPLIGVDHQTVCLVNLTRELERHRTALMGVKAAFEATFQPDFGGVDWRDDAAIQSFANIFGRLVYREFQARVTSVAFATDKRDDEEMP